jgi:adenylate kinase
LEGPKRILIVVGIPGVGKTTVILKTEEILLKSGSRTTVAVFGTVMLNEAKKIGVDKRDEIRRLSISQQQDLQNKASEHIRSIANEFIIVDTHLFVRTPSGFLPGIPLNVVQNLRPTNLVLITASPKEIHERRAVDQTRDRDILSLEEIQRELELARSMISTISIISGAPFEIVNNSSGGIEIAASQIANILKRH